MSIFSSRIVSWISNMSTWKFKLPTLNLTLFKKNFGPKSLFNSQLTNMLQLSNMQTSGITLRNSPNKHTKICVLIPAFNEEKNLEVLICQLRQEGIKNIFVIDGKSSDNTVKIAETMGATVLIQEGFGKGSAVRDALNTGLIDVDKLILMDADGSMSPKELPLFLDALESGADVVKGSRFMKGGGTYDMSLLRRFGNYIIVSTFNFLCGTKYTDLCYGYFGFNRQSIQKLTPLLQSKHFEIEAEILLKSEKLGLKVKEVPSIEFERKSGQSNLKTFRDGFSILKTIIREFIELS